MNLDMSVSDKLALGFQTTGLGLLVVFVALALIIFIIMALSAMLGDKKKKAAETRTVPTMAPSASAAPVAPVASVVQQNNDSELIAVLTAAAACYLTGDVENTTGLVVRSYRRIESESAWGKAGRNSQIFNKF